MATLAKFKVTGFNQSVAQKEKGICSVTISAVGSVGLFGSSSSPEQLSITRSVPTDADYIALQAAFPKGTVVEGFKTRKLITKPWTNSNNVVIRHRLYLSNNETESNRDEALVAAEYAKYEAVPAPAPAPEPATAVAEAMQPLTA